MATSPLVFRDIKVRIDDNSDGTTSDESVAQLSVDNGTVVLFVFEFIHKIGGTESPFEIDAAGTPLALRVSINESRTTNAAQLTYQTAYNQGYIAAFEDLETGKFTSLVTIDPTTCNSFLGTKDEAPAHLTVTLTDADGLVQRLYEAPIIIKAVGADLPAPPPVPAASYLTAVELAAQYYTGIETDTRLAALVPAAVNVLSTPILPAANSITLIIAVGGSTVLTVTNDTGVAYTATPTLVGATHALGCASTPTATQYFAALAYLLNQLEGVSAAADGATSVTITAATKATLTYEVAVTGTSISGGHLVSTANEGLTPTPAATVPPTYLELARQATVKRLAYWIHPTGMANTSGVSLSGTGNVSNIYETVSGAVNLGTDDGGYHQEFDTGSSTNNESTWGINHYWFHALPTANFFYWVRFGLSDLTNVRFFAGLSKYGTYNNTIDSDDYNADHLGITFSTARPDTNFQFLTRKVSVGQTLTDTGVAPDASKIYDLEIEWSSSGTSVRMRLSEHDGTIVKADTTITTNLPTAALDPTMGIRTLTTAAAGFRFYRAELWI